MAQLTAAYYADRNPILVSVGAPCIGNAPFCEFLNSNVSPNGGLRYWNYYDPIPYLALVVGYLHPGISVHTTLREDAKKMFFQHLQKEFPLPTTIFDIAAPHLIYHIGSLSYAFPMFYLY